jgi:phosphate acetyltransferase
VDTQAIEEQVIAFQPRGITPGMFLFTLQQKAREQKMHIVLPEGEDERILRATEHLLNHKLVKLTLIGKEEELERKISRLGLNFSRDDFQILDPVTYEGFEDFVNTFYGLRQHKGITMDIARDVMADVSYFGTMMVYKGLADGMVSGAQHTTQHTIRPALQFIKTQPGIQVVSSIFFMALDDRVLVYGDCAVNPNPSAEELAEIGIASAETSKTFGIVPRVAMLSYSSGSSGKGEDVEKVRKATRLIRERRPDLQVEGPLQYDAAVDPGVAAKKMPDSDVAGQATVLIFPDLNTGNNTYKAVQRETGAMAIGPMLQGLNKPVNDLSRGATIEDVINTVIITAIQAQEVRVRSKQKPQTA